MEEKTIQSIPVMTFALMLGIISAVIGLIIGIFYAAVFGYIIAAIPASSTATTSALNIGFFSILFGAGAIITIPVICFIGGLIQGALVAILYNFLAPKIGGIKLRFKKENNAPPQQ
jgi:hypothetical protein